MKSILRSGLEGLCLFPFVLVLATVFIVDEKLVNETVSAKYFWFYPTLAVSGLVLIPVYLLRQKKISFGWADSILLLFTAWVLFRSGSFGFYGHTKQVLLVLLIILYFYFRVLLSQKKLFGFMLMVFLIGCGGVEAAWGLRQLYGLDRSQHDLFLLTGSFFNPGPYSGYLVLTVPPALYLILSDGRIMKKKFFRRFGLFYLRLVVSVFTVCLVLMVLPATMSRASWIACAIGSFYAVVGHFWNRRKLRSYMNGSKKWIVLIILSVCILFAGLSTGMYYLKKDSADGRALTWKVSLKLIGTHPWGVGLNQFSGEYGKEQAAYFAAGNGTKQEEYVAGSPSYAFNEYLQIACESGIVGLALFLWYLAVIFRRGILFRRTAAVSSLLALLVFAGMSYPFSVLPFLIVLMFLSASVVSGKNPADTTKNKETKQLIAESDSRMKNSRNNFSICFVLSCLLILSGFSAYNLKMQQTVHSAYKEWQAVRRYFYSQIYPEAVKRYADLYPYLSDQASFLFEYAQCLSRIEEYQKSNRILDQAVRINCDPMLYNIMGKNFQELKQYKEAERCFMEAFYIIPERIYPRYLLAKLYREWGKEDKALDMAIEVIKKEPKVPSQATDEMKKEMQRLILEVK